MMMLRGGFVLAALVALSAMFAAEAGAVSLQVNCGGGAPFVTIQSAVDAACSGDSISVAGACDESVTIANENAGCLNHDVLLPMFTKLSIRGTSTTQNNNTGLGPAFLITGNARNVTLSTFTVGSAAGHGIQVASAHRVTLSNIRTAPSTAPGVFAFLDGINIDTASTRVRVLSSVLNNNGDDGVENGSTDGEVSSVTANDNEGIGIHVPGSNVMVSRCKADDTSAGNVQDEGYRFDGPGAIVQQCTARDNVVAQFHDTAASTGVIHFRNTAGNSSSTMPVGAGFGFWEEGSGNRINSCSVYKNASHGVLIDGSGDALQLSTVSQNVGSQLRITGDRNFIQSNSFTRVSTGNFTSAAIAVHAPAGADVNYFERNRVSLTSGAATGEGYTVDDADNNGERNSRAPSDPNDPPANLR